MGEQCIPRVVEGPNLRRKHSEGDISAEGLPWTLETLRAIAQHSPDDAAVILREQQISPFGDL